MCGIAGLFTVERRVDATLVSAVLRMLDAQVHRGPNDWALLVPEAATADPEVRAVLGRRGWDHVLTYPGSAEAPAAILGARRLSIVDLSMQARIPMGSADRRVWVTYNGEIYNFTELRAELQARGHVFRSSGDTETLVFGYVEWGDDLVHKLRGMFALAVLDARSSSPRILLARDRFGIKPLYHARVGCALQFASEVRALVAGGLVTNEVEPRGLHGFLVYGSVPSPWTTVRHVLALPSAHRLRVDAGSYGHARPERYWSVPARTNHGISVEEAAAEAGRLLEESVRQHLVSDVPLGVFLSGGMDSSALVALASRHSVLPLTTVSLTFDEPEYSEAEYAATVARKYGTKHVEVRLRPRDFVDELPRVLAAMDQPSTDGVNTYFVAKAAREAGLTVVLSGVGGDEIFWGYPGIRWVPRLAQVTRLAGVGALAAGIGRLGRGLGYPRLEKLEFLREAGLGPYLVARGMFLPSTAARLLGCGPLPMWRIDGGVEMGGRPLTSDDYARLDLAHYLEDQLVRDTDVFSMTHSLEVRVPFLDHRLAEFLLSLPAAHLTAGAGSKPLLARAIHEHHPAGFGSRPKMGFTFPFDPWMRASIEAIRAHADHPEPVAEEPFNAITRAFKAGLLHWSRFWALAVLRALSRHDQLPRWQGPEKPRRVLLLLPQVYGAKGGIPIYNQRLIQAVGEALPKTAVEVISVNDAGLPAAAPIRGRVSFYGTGPRSSSFHRLRVLWMATIRALHFRPDLIVCGHINLSLLTWALGRLTGARSVLVALGIEAWQPARHLRWAARRADLVAPLSRFTAERMIEWGLPRERMALVPGMVDGEVFRPLPRRTVADPRRGPCLLTVGRLARSERYKGVERVLAVLPDVRRRHPTVSYLVAGDGDDLPRLRRLATEAGIADAVTFLGLVPDEALPQLYGDVDLFVMPSSKEGFGIVFLEALACGTPVVAGNRDGSVDAVLDGRLGRLVDPDDSAALAAAITTALDAVAERTPEARRRRREETLAAYGYDRFCARVGRVLADA
jgi:asparagine synthase (glutamine-hydrolysing)